MNLANTFEYQYERLDNDKLISIVTNSRSFQPMAVETAYLELQRRVLSPGQTAEVNESFTAYLKHKLELENAALAAPKTGDGKLKKARKPFLTAVRLINTVALTVMAVFFISLIQGDTVVLSMIIHRSSYRSSFIFIAIPYLMLPFGAIGFGLQRQLGWIMLAWALVYNTLQQAWFLKNDIMVKLDPSLGDSVTVDEVVKSIIVFSFYLLLSVVVCLPGIRKKMKTSDLAMFLTMMAAVVFFVLQVQKMI